MRRYLWYLLKAIIFNLARFVKLKRLLNGLKQASRQWNQEFSSRLISFGFIQSAHDHYLFVKGTGVDFVALLIYVDDVLITNPSSKLITEVKMHLDNLFTINDLVPARYLLGFQGYYYFTSSECEIKCNWGLPPLASSSPLPIPSNFKLTAMSTGRLVLILVALLLDFIFFLGALVSWKMKKQATISHLSAEAEYRSMWTTLCELQWLSYLLQDFGVLVHTPIPMFCDNKADLHIMPNPVFYERTKYFDIGCRIDRNQYKLGFMVLSFIRSKE
ncbi:UNVERIFIED_CONTAM: hypothetical protein Sangu_1719900 [Sesamum angustifolium]|uniref:Reverse transcriptase Ty1/copia-type domain-containing protein n=1 Tax=Sesamum angustifolium TaxID=2727405 RepID=A0AAW2MJM5_9LAMI